MKLIKAFKNAINGMTYFFLHERNGKIQLAIAALVVVLGWGLQVSRMEWLVLMGCIAAVLSFEMMNSALEKLCDVVQKEFHPSIKLVKDMAAAAVVWVSILSAIAGLTIFLPRIF